MEKPKFKIKKLRLGQLDRSIEIQSRVKLDPDTLREYRQAWEESGEFPPITVFCTTEGKYLIADGFHRSHSLLTATLPIPTDDRQIECEIREGSYEEAVLYSLSANIRHGLRPSNLDKQRAVLMYWGLGEAHCNHSNKMVAKACGVSHTHVANLKKEITEGSVGRMSAIAESIGFKYERISQIAHNLKNAGDTIVTQRGGKELVQTKTKRTEPDPATLPDVTHPESLPGGQHKQQYISLGTTEDNPIPRHQIVSGIPSLANGGMIVVDGGQLMPEVDAIAIPYAIGDSVAALDEPAIPLRIEGYKLLGSDLKAECLHFSGSKLSLSIDHLQPYNPTQIQQQELLTQNIKKGFKNLELQAHLLENNTDTDSRSVPVDLTKLSISELEALKLAVDRELANRATPSPPADS